MVDEGASVAGDRGARGVSQAEATGEGEADGGADGGIGGVEEAVWADVVRALRRCSREFLRVLTWRRVLRTDQTRGREERGRLVIASCRR